MSIRMQQRRGTATVWLNNDPILAPGEIGIESDTNKFKVGDGVTTWSNLKYFSAGLTSVSVSSDSTLQVNTKCFVDTSAVRTLTLPASPSLGDEIVIFDATGQSATNNITVSRNGNKINSITDNAIIDVNQSTSIFTYTGTTIGWRFE
jgi:hypothetical protein